MNQPQNRQQNFTRARAVLVLEDGRTFRGRAYGVEGRRLGEVVFTTGMTGYQETLTDPSYAGQIVVQTAPHIGNTGVNEEDDESSAMWVAGYVVSQPSRRVSNWRATQSLEDRLIAEDIVGISGIDTRALTRHLRDRGAMRAGIFSGAEAELSDADMLAAVQDSPRMAGQSFTDTVTTKEPYVVPAVGEKRFTVVAFDLGIKSATPEQLSLRGIEVHVVPADFTFDQVKEIGPDGVFFSNGPGDPSAADHPVELLRQVLEARIPFFGICFGNQLLGRALGFGTYKLVFGHRGANQPVLDVSSGRVEITCQNHGFAVDAPVGEIVEAPVGGLGRVQVSHVGLNDQVVEGLACLDVPAFSVQFHPESAAGPHDSRSLFDRFADLMAASGAVRA